MAVKAIEEGVARKKMTYEEELKNAEEIIGRSRRLTKTMMDNGFIPEAPV